MPGGWDSVMARLDAAAALLDDERPIRPPQGGAGPYRLGVDLGTADVVVMAVDAEGNPAAAFLEWASVVRDGVVVDYFGAIELTRKLVAKAEKRLGVHFTEAATSFPPGTDPRLSTNILDAAGLTVSGFADEPTCVALLAGLNNAAVVDIGGGTTGTAVIKGGRVVFSADEPTGGHHLTLVLSGALRLPYAEAELKKRGPGNEAYAATLAPVFERIADIVRKHIRGHKVRSVHLTGGTCCFPGIDKIFERELGLPVVLPSQPLLLTPLAIASLRLPATGRGT